MNARSLNRELRGRRDLERDVWHRLYANIGESWNLQ